jgi:pimeloyl-ACP methyl ester carboxylesterase
MIRKLFPLILILIAAAAGGCRSNAPLEGQNLVVLVPGCAGDGFWYNALRESVSENQPARTVRTFQWGLPLPLYMMNLQDPDIHAKAEKSFAKALKSWRGRYPSGRLTLLGHSAGCGVILGTLARLDKPVDVENVVLLAPSVSPNYDIGPALRHIRGILHVFHSDADTLWLGWRTSTFGTYDSVHTAAAGKIGFNVDHLDPTLRTRVMQHGYEPDYNSLGNAGGHWGSLVRRFDDKAIAPLLAP